MKSKIYLLILLCSLQSFAQTFKNGLILTVTDNAKYDDRFCCVLAPPEGFAAYDQPSGKIIGKIARVGNIKIDDQVPYHIYFITANKKIELENLESVGYEISALNYTDEVAGFVKITVPEKSVWLKISEIKKQGFQAVTWLNYLIKQSPEVLGYYANDPGLNIRKEPNAESEIIGSARGDLFEIKLSNETSGSWVKVTVIKSREHVCNTELSEKDNFEYKSEGWMKILDDDGAPNIWSYQKGC